MRPDPMEYQFIVHGKPTPQGSKIPMKGGKGFRDPQSLIAWRAKAKTAMLGRDGKPPIRFDVPVYVVVEAFFDRPKTSATDYPVARNLGDVDKIARAALDALTEAAVIQDDSYVIDVRCLKGFTDHPAYTKIRVGRVDYWTYDQEPLTPPTQNPYAPNIVPPRHLVTCWDPECPGCFAS